MFHLHVLLLLLCPVEPDLPDHATPAEWAALKTLAYQLEVVADTEEWCADWQSEVRCCRWRLRETWDCPPLAATAWLPPREVCQDNGRWAALLLARYETEAFLAPHRTAVWAAAIDDQRCRVAAWEAAVTAGTLTDIVSRRQALRTVRAWDAVGGLPPPGAWAAFREVAK